MFIVDDEDMALLGHGLSKQSQVTIAKMTKALADREKRADASDKALADARVKIERLEAQAKTWKPKP
jgi:hypothetical protein